MFGEKFILNQPDEIINLLLSAWDLTHFPKNDTFFNTLSKSEKLNFFEIYKLYYRRLINYHTITDHIRFYTFLKIWNRLNGNQKLTMNFLRNIMIGLRSIIIILMGISQESTIQLLSNI
jgi:hypothetical protein